MAVAYYIVDHTQIDSALSNFPVGVHIEASTGFMAGLGSSDWQNLHATVDSVECYVEVDVWDYSGGEAYLWIRIPTVSASVDTIIKIEIGASNTTYVGQAGDTAAQLVWDSNFSCRFGMCQDPSGGTGCIIDSTANNRDATPTGSMTSGDLVDADFGKSIDFDGVNDGVATAAFTRGAAAITIEIYISANAQSTSLGGWIANQRNASTGDQWQVNYYYPSLSNNDLFFSLYGSTNTAVARGQLPNTQNGGWICMAAASSGVSGDPLYTYQDGALVDTDTLTGAVQYNASALAIGKQAWAVSGYYSGKIGEIRLSNTVRSAAWIKATAACFSETLLTYTDSLTSVSASIGISASAEAARRRSADVYAALGLSATATANKLVGGVVASGFGLSAVATAANRTVVARQMALSGRPVYRYYATLTGGPDGQADYLLPGLKSVQLRMRDGEASYVSVSLVYDTAAAAAIADRPSGRILVDMAGVVAGVELVRETLIEADLYSFRYDRGATNQSITLVAYATRTYAGRTATLQDVVTESMLADGRMQFRCARPDFYLRPGDTVNYGVHSIVAGQVSCLISPTQQYMDVMEVDA